MSFYIVDVESDGPIPNVYSMVCFGAVLTSDVSKTFYGKTFPISDKFDPAALFVSGISREEHLKFDDPKEVMIKFNEWIESTTEGRPVFVSDNNGYDFAWINYYFHYYLGKNPFGFSSRRIGDIYCGIVGDLFKANEWKKMRKTKHSHNPIDDAIGNAEAFNDIIKMMKRRY